ncbi:hypothetical protein TRVL_06110 [Trypanosoma vivax]|nr:hypothetical protein TRVL_06110 [Trypanosoma vivax]
MSFDRLGTPCRLHEASEHRTLRASTVRGSKATIKHAPTGPPHSYRCTSLHVFAVCLFTVEARFDVWRDGDFGEVERDKLPFCVLKGIFPIDNHSRWPSCGFSRASTDFTSLPPFSSRLTGAEQWNNKPMLKCDWICMGAIQDTNNSADTCAW